MARWSIAGFTAAVILINGPFVPAAAASKPNIIFILVDDMGWGDLGVFYQNSRNFSVNRASPAFVTPKLDTMAAEGLQLRRHYCPAPVCAPSRASLLLGVHQGHANVRDNQFDKALENNHTLGTVLKQAGYATAMIGKYGLQGSGLPAPARPELRGFDYFFGFYAHGDAHYHYPKETAVTESLDVNVYDGTNDIVTNLDKCYSTDLFTARAKKWMLNYESTNAAQPFFLYLAFTAPHARLDVPTQAYPAGGGTNGGLQWTGTPGNMINTASGTINSYIHPDYASATYDNDSNPGTAEIAWPNYAKRHATMIRRLDDAVADIFQTLKDLNIDTNTLVVFTSDNGPHNEAGTGGSYTQDPRFFRSFGPMDGIKRDTWEGGMREPTLVRWPGHIPSGTTNFTASQFQDWMPTFAELAGVPAPARSDGVSLVPTLTGTGAQREGIVYVEYNYAGATPSYTEFETSHRGATRNEEQIIHLEGYKGIRYNITSSTDNFRIYDTLNDPKETTNLAGSNSYFIGLQQRMKDRVLQVRRPGGGVSRPYDSALVPSMTVTSLVPGLDYRAFEGSYPWVPDFTPIASVTNGTCTNVNVSVRTRDNNIGLFFTGYLNVPVDGDYTFYLTADTGALLRIHEATVLDADHGYTGGIELSATIKLQAGKHPIRFYYIRGTNGSPALNWSWSGPGFAKEQVPPTALFRTFPVPPQAIDDAASTKQGTPVVIDVLGNDFDDGSPQPLSIQSVAQPSGGTNQIIGSQIQYTPAPGFLGQDAFQYTITDGSNNATATVKVSVYFESSELIWFPFNQTSGLSTVEAGGGRTATLTGFSNPTSPWGAGKFGRGLVFQSASSQYASINGFNGILGASNRTCAAWVKTTSAAQMPVIAWGPNSAGSKWTFLLQNGHVRIEATSGYLEGTRTVNDGNWHQVAVTFTSDGTPDIIESKLYIDGTVETSFTASLTRTVNTTASGNVTIGADIPSAQNRYFTGTIDEPRIYNRTLSAAEISALYSATNQSAAAWYYRYYGNVTNDWSANSDGDAATQFGEYAFGANPRVADVAGRLDGKIVAGKVQVSYPRLIAGTAEVNYTVESTANLQSWLPLSGSGVSAVALPEWPGYERATFEGSSQVMSNTSQLIRVRCAFQ